MTMPAELSPWPPGREGYYGDFGGAFIPEVLHETFAELREAFDTARRDPEFWQSYTDLMATYAGRPTPVTYCDNLTRTLGGARVYVKREDLNHTGAHKANNVMGQGLLVQRMGKRRVIAETGTGQHGVATATMAARLGSNARSTWARWTSPGSARTSSGWSSSALRSSPSPRARGR